MTTDLEVLSGKPVTAIHTDNGFHGADQMFVWLRHLGDDEITDLETRWLNLKIPFGLELNEGNISLARRLGVVIPERVPAWDANFAGTYGEWCRLRDQADVALVTFRKQLEGAVARARTELFLSAGGHQTNELWLDGGRTFSDYSGLQWSGDGRMQLFVHEGNVFSSPRGVTIDPDAFTRAKVAGQEAYDEAVASNIEGIQTMNGEDLLDVSPLGFLDDYALESDVLGLPYSEWTALAEQRRAELLERATGKDEGGWDKLEGLKNDGLTFMNYPGEARSEAQETLLRRSDIFVVPDKIVSTLLECRADFDAQKEYDEDPELQKVLAQATNSPSGPRRRRGLFDKRGRKGVPHLRNVGGGPAV